MLEDLPLEEIEAYFADRGFELTIHRDPPPGEESTAPFWVALGSVARWYGRGDTPEAALRRAAQRWREEQLGPDDGGEASGRPLPP